MGINIKTFFTVVILLSSSGAFAQDSLTIYNNYRDQIKTTGMTVLGSWAAANIAVSTVGYFNSTGSTKSFYQMNAIWGIANLGIATAGYLGTRKDSGKLLSPTESLIEQKKIETIFLINGGLDLVYIGTGFFLKNRGERNSSDKLRGYGTSVVLQGGFLLLFDSVMYGSQKHNGNGLRKFLEKNPLIFDGQKVGMLIRL